MNFYKMLRILEAEQPIEPTRRIPPTNAVPFQDLSDVEDNANDVTFNNKKKNKYKDILPIRDYLLNIKVGQEAAVMLSDTPNVPFSKGWTVETKGERFIRLKKEPTDNSSGGSLVVPNQVYMNWQLAYDQKFNSRG